MVAKNNQPETCNTVTKLVRYYYITRYTRNGAVLYYYYYLCCRATKGQKDLLLVERVMGREGFNHTSYVRHNNIFDRSKYSPTTQQHFRLI